MKSSIEEQYWKTTIDLIIMKNNIEEQHWRVILKNNNEEQ